MFRRVAYIPNNHLGAPDPDFRIWEDCQVIWCQQPIALIQLGLFDKGRISIGKRRRLQDQSNSRSLTYSQTAPQPALENEKPINPGPPEPGPWHLVPGIVKYGLHFGTRKTAFPRKCLQIISLLRRTIIQVGFSPIIVRASCFRAAFQPKAAGRGRKWA